MKVITIGSSKGGVGKSTIACNLAVEATKGGIKTLLIDADIQASSMVFREIRSNNELLPQFSAVAIVKDTIRHDVKTFKDFDLVLIDAGGRDARTFRGAITAADLFIIPVLPSPYDVWATEDTITALSEVNTIIPIESRILLNQVVAKTRLAADIGEALEGLKINGKKIERLKTVLHHRTAYKRSINDGMGVSEYSEADGRAASEIESLWEELMKWL